MNQKKENVVISRGHGLFLVTNTIYYQDQDVLIGKKSFINICKRYITLHKPCPGQQLNFLT